MTTRPPGDPREQAITEILVRHEGRLSLRARTVRVEILAGPSAGQVHELPGPEIRIGTGKTAHLVLFDPAVSRHHVTLRIEPAGIRVVDPGSSNGTVLDGVRVLDAYAREASLVVIGSSTLRVRLSTSVVEIPLSSRESFGGLLGRSVAMRQVFTLLERVSAASDPILVEGETGTGKELVAEAIHEESPRASGPFVIFDCSAVTPSLVESELFGHVRGAFTGAVGDRVGAFEAASGGTLFLDEIGELPIDLQPKLLRALERLEVKRVGDNQVRRVDVRVVAATNRNLAEEVTQRRFREDLYYRLAVIRLELPPLRARPDDVPLLVDHFVARSGKTLDPNVRAELLKRAWPGNVRELRNGVARALSLGTVESPHAPQSTRGGSAEPAPIDFSVPFALAKDRHNDAFETTYLTEALRITDGNATKAAELAGVNRKYMQRAIKRLGLRARLP